MRVLGEDPATGEEITLRNGRFGEYVQQGEGEKPKRSSLPKGLSADDVTLEKALKLLALPREVARHPSSGEPILAGIGRYGAYVQHGKTYANLGRDDDVLEIGANRAIDLIVAKESGAGRRAFRRRAGARSRRPSGGRAGQRQAGPLRALRQSRQDQRHFAQGDRPGALTLAEAVELLKAKAAGGGVIGRLVGEHPDGGPVTVRDGRFGAYVNWGKVNATLPKGVAPDSVTLSQALDLIAEREGRPAAQPRKPARAAAKGKPAKSPAKAKAADGAGARGKSAASPTARGEEGRRAQAEVRRQAR